MSDFVSGTDVLFGLGTMSMTARQTESIAVVEPPRSERIYRERSPRAQTRRKISEKCLNSPYLSQPFQMKPVPPIVKVKAVKARTQPMSARRFEIPTLQQRRYKTFEVQELGYVERKKAWDKQRQDFFNELKANCQYNMRQDWETIPYEVDQNCARNQSLRRSEIAKREREEMDVMERQSRLIECEAALKEELKRKPRSSYNDEMYHGQCTSLRFIPVTDRLNNATGAAYVHI